MKENQNATLANCIRIDFPPGTNVDIPLCIPLDSGNCFNASGGTNDPNVSFVSVQGQIVDTPICVPGNVIDPLHWNIPGLGPLLVGRTYELLVTAYITVSGSSGTRLCAHSKHFIAVKDNCHTHSGHSPAAESMFAQVMPRYFRMRLQEEIPNVASRAGSLTLGGLMEPSSVYLAYNSEASTLAAPVWCDINLPDNVGRWILRVTQSCYGSNAELVQQTLGPREVRTPMAFRCDCWSFRGPNVFVLAHSTCGDAGPARLTVVVEPA